MGLYASARRDAAGLPTRLLGAREMLITGGNGYARAARNAGPPFRPMIVYLYHKIKFFNGTEKCFICKYVYMYVCAYV